MSDLPEKLRPYSFLGVKLSFKQGDSDAYATCPFCTRVGKFGIRIDTGQFRCVVCDEKGNLYTFMKKLWKEIQGDTDITNELANNRKLQRETLIHWELKWNPYTKNWMVPGFNAEKALTGLYLYVNDEERFKLLPTPTLGHHLFGMNLYDVKKPHLWLCEGVWDAMALYEGLVVLEKLDKANVIAIPAAQVWYDTWLPVFKGKEIILCCQNDHERKNPNTGKRIEPASWTGMRKIWKAIKSTVKSVNILQWGDYGYNKKLPSGYDVRDLLNA